MAKASALIRALYVKNSACSKTTSTKSISVAKIIIPEKGETEKTRVEGEGSELAFHTCGEKHHCELKCSVEGVCQLELKVDKREWKNSFGTTKYDYYIQTPHKQQCNHQIPEMKEEHEGGHRCEKDAHQCDQQCPECKAFCQKNYGHAGLHMTTTHRNKEQNIFVATSKKKPIKIKVKESLRKYEVGESCEPEYCSESCLRKGRAHYHLIPCPKNHDASVACPAESNPGVRHSTEKFEPYTDVQFDLWLCENYWKNHEWEMPVNKAKTREIMGCNFYCTHPSHKDEKQFCGLNAWHSDKHHFECTHEDGDLYSDNVDVVFCVDNTGSMSSYIAESKNTMSAIINKFTKKKLSKNFRFGFVGYRDHPPEDCTYVTVIKNLTDQDTMLKYISTVTASGGGDGPEAVLDGLYDSANKISWRKESCKFVIHIADAPPHGKQYVSSGDGFPGGCPCGYTIENIAATFKSKNIRYKLMKIGSYPNQMAEVFKRHFHDYDCTELTSAVHLVSAVPERVIKAFSVDEINMIEL